jgi:cysteine desulfurase
MWFFSPNKRIYLDYASATPVLPEAQKAMAEAGRLLGNPGSIHTEGVEAQKSLDSSREAIARELACKSREVIFTSGGTEGNNLAILGFARKLLLKGDLSKTHWIVGSIEHPSVLECFMEIERLGGTVTHVDPDKRGVIWPKAVVEEIKPETVFISIGWANSEIGIIQPIRDIVRAVREINDATIFHSDAGQAPAYLAAHVHTLGVDLLTLDAGKFYGPRGVGALYISNRRELAPVLLGGGQERGLRAGTENVALAAGFAAALCAIAKERAAESYRLGKLRDAFARDIAREIPEAVVNGDLKRSMPHIVNISIPKIQSEYVTLALDAAGVSISTKSACREGEDRRSRVVEQLTDEGWRAENTLRFSLGRGTTEKDLSATVAKLSAIIAKNKT